MSIAMPQMKFPTAKPWWMYCKWAGWLILAVALLSNQPILWAIAAHWLVDFTFQSSFTAAGKAKRSPTIIGYHSFISGGFTGFIAGGLIGLAISMILHFVIDYYYKPIVGPSGLTHTLDQVMHHLIILAIFLFVGGAM